jgi:DNA-binding response OmpR family regulator
MSPKNEDTLVLVADDEPSMLALLSAYIRSKGYRVLEASDGDMAWQLAHQHLPHCVVLDVMMPGMSGWEVCKKIRESVSLAHTGVVMLTGIGESLNELTSPLYGADAYIDKPFEFAELESRIRETLERRRAGTLGRPDGGSDEDAGEPKDDDDRDDRDDDDDDDSDGPDSERASKQDDEPITQRLAKLSRKKAKAVRKPKAAREESDADADDESPAPEPKRAGKKAAGKKKAAKKAALKPAAAKPAKKAGKKKAAKKAAGKKKASKKAAPQPAAKKAGKKKASKKAAPGKKKAAKKAPAKAPAAKKAAGKKKAKKSGKR